MGKPLVLAVNPDKKQLDSIKACLDREEFKVHTATNSQEALRSMKKHPASILISDENTPDAGGLDFLRKIKHKYPHTVRCIISSDTEADEITQSLMNKEICSSLQKPWEKEELLHKIRDCLERFRISEANRESMQMILSAYQKANRPRGEDLVLSTALLNVLPQAAIVLDEDFRVIISNDIYIYKIAAEMQNLELPDKLIDQLRSQLDNRWVEFRLVFRIKNTDYSIRMRPLRNTDSKSAILFFDPQQD